MDTKSGIYDKSSKSIRTDHNINNLMFPELAEAMPQIEYEDLEEPDHDPRDSKRQFSRKSGLQV